MWEESCHILTFALILKILVKRNEEAALITEEAASPTEETASPTEEATSTYINSLND